MVEVVDRLDLLLAVYYPAVPIVELNQGVNPSVPMEWLTSVGSSSFISTSPLAVGEPFGIVSAILLLRSRIIAVY